VSRNQRRLRIVPLIAVALLTAGCTGTGSDGGAPTATEPAIGSAGGTATLVGGAKLIAPAGAVETEAKITSKRTASPSGLPPEITESVVIDIELSTELAAPVDVIFPVNDRSLLDPARGVIVGYHEGASGAEYLPATVNEVNSTVTITTNSLSPLGWFHIDTSAVREQLGKVFDSMFGGFFEDAPTPECEMESEALEGGWSISSSTFDTVDWCFGIEDDRRVVNIVNTRRYPLMIDAPRSADLLSRSDRGFTARISESALPENDLVLEPGAEARWSVDPEPGVASTFRTNFDGLAQAIGSVEVAVEWIEAFASKLPGGPRGGKEALLRVIEESDCLLALGGLTDSENSFDAGDAFDLVKGCLSRDTLKAWGGTIFGTVVAAPIGLIFGTADYFRGAWQAGVNTISGKVRYEISVSRGVAGNNSSAACGNLMTEDGPIGTTIIAGTTTCAQARRILGCILVAGNCTIAGDYESGWTVEGWECEIETAEGNLNGYTCRSPDGIVVATGPPIGLDDIRAFVGTWNQHAGYLSILSDGTIEMVIQVYPRGPADPTFPELVLTTINVSPTSLTAEVVESDEPTAVAVGTSYTFAITDFGLRMSGGPLGASSWCNDSSFRQGICGA
jgi:hypothetical protein